ncbi:Smr/MutS family protein [Dehalogenimonas formicexedens]|nr:Smr/MutS family protein [Dehalogenimonas formicexedens]
MSKKTRPGIPGGKSPGNPGYPDAVPSLDLHGLTVVEALPEVDEFLHSSFRAGYFRVRVIHGKGTGVLKLEVARYLATHPLVLRYQSSDSYHGGSGATEVDITNR